MAGGETQQHNETVSEEIVDTKLDNLEANVEKGVAIGLIRALNEDIPGFDIKLSVKDKNEYVDYYIVGGNENIILNIPLNIKELEKYCNDIENLINYNGEIQLIGGTEWRAIAEVNLIGAGGDRIVNIGHKSGKGEGYYRGENNKTEELFTFIQKLKGIPEKDWKINEAIKNSGPIGFSK